MERIALITGASGGIGEASAKALAGLGYLTVLGYRTGEEEVRRIEAEITAAGGKAEPFRMDVTSEASLEAAVSFAEHLGSLEVLVNCAGIADIRQIQDVTPESIAALFAVNTTSVILACREAAKVMIPRKQGSIINISSMWGVTGASCETVYSASKGAVVTFTKALAAELGPSGIRVNCIAPGVIDTRMNAHLSPEDLQALADSTPLGRIGRPEDVAEAVCFFAGAGFVTGQCLTVDGGFTL